MSGLGRFQTRVAFVYGAALTSRVCDVSGVAGLDTSSVWWVCYSMAYLLIFEFFEF